MAIERFEDLIAWQKARVLTREVYELTRREHVCRDYKFCSQIQAAAVSIMSNIAEGFERKAPRQFEHFLLMAKASCAEVRSLLYVALDIQYILPEEFSDLMERANEVGRVLADLYAQVVTHGASGDSVAIKRSDRQQDFDPKTRNSELGTRNPAGARRG